jgi:hypothetical protein
MIGTPRVQPMLGADQPVAGSLEIHHARRGITGRIGKQRIDLDVRAVVEDRPRTIAAIPDALQPVRAARDRFSPAGAQNNRKRESNPSAEPATVPVTARVSRGRFRTVIVLRGWRPTVWIRIGIGLGLRASRLARAR